MCGVGGSISTVGSSTGTGPPPTPLTPLLQLFLSFFPPTTTLVELRRWERDPAQVGKRSPPPLPFPLLSTAVCTGVLHCPKGERRGGSCLTPFQSQSLALGPQAATGHTGLSCSRIFPSSFCDRSSFKAYAAGRPSLFLHKSCRNQFIFPPIP